MPHIVSAGLASLTYFSPIAVLNSDAYAIIGQVTIAPGTPLPPGDELALYLTAREDVSVWQSSVRGQKPPPLFSKKIVDLTKGFPVDVSLTEEDLTEEGTALKDKLSIPDYKILISARLDEDGD